MKNFGMIAFTVAALALTGCSSNKSSNMGAVNADKACDKQGACCSEGQKKDAAMGAVSDKKAGSCSGQSGCSSSGTCTSGAKAN